MSRNESQPYIVPLVQVWMISDKWLSRYGLNTYFRDVLDFDLWPHPWHRPLDQISWNESLPFIEPLVQVWMLSDKWLSRYGLNTTLWKCTRFWPLAPPPWHGTLGQMSWNESKPYWVPMVHVWMLSGKWFPRYRLLENFNTKILFVLDELNFDLWPHPLAWTLGSVVMEWKLTLTGYLWSEYECFLMSGCQDIDF